jgi:hypothetical protein
MAHVLKGMLAGLAATVVLSALMLMKAMIGFMPELDLPRMISGMMGAPDTPVIGWVVHFMIGIVIYGAAIGLLDGKLPGSHTVQGVILGAVGWLIMMVLLMPMAGAGLFGMALGVMAPIMTLMLHLIFGAVLGWVYGRSVRREETPSGVHA